MFGILLPILTVCILVVQCNAERDIKTTPTATTKTTFIGTADVTKFSSQNFTTARFIGIPYALRAVRFSKPILNTPIDGNFTAKTYGDICPQNANGSGACDQQMSENCLYLNIYVPLGTFKHENLSVSSTTTTSNPITITPHTGEVPKAQSEGNVLLLPASEVKHAVFIFIHGGAYISGNGNCYDGSVLAGFGNIIVVTINYRLGVFGLLSTNDDVIPGNLALWDQHVAIQWVKNHIDAFGGDPNLITVGGQSSGSYSTIHQALFTGNENLFQRVIAQSGTPAAAKSVSFTGYNTTIAVAKALNCSITSSKQNVKSCLMNKTQNELINVQISMDTTPGSLPLQPTVEAPFIPVDPYLIMSQVVANRSAVPKHFISKDLLIGIDSQDGEIVLRIFAQLLTRGNAAFLKMFLNTPITLSLFKQIIVSYFQKDYNDTVDESLVEAILDRYIKWDNPEDNISRSNQLIEILTDVAFAIPSLDTASAHIQSQVPKGGSGTDDQSGHTSYMTTASQTGSADQNRQGGSFVYRFSTPVSTTSQIPWFNGTGHSAEIPYLFGSKMLLNEVDVSLSKNVMAYWSNFVKFGDPNRNTPPPSTGAEHELRLPTWNEYSLQDEQFLELSTNPESSSHMRASYRHFWTKFIPFLQSHVEKVFNDGRSTVQEEKCSKNQHNNQTILRVNFLFLILLIILSLAFIFKM